MNNKIYEQYLAGQKIDSENIYEEVLNEGKILRGLQLLIGTSIGSNLASLIPRVAIASLGLLNPPVLAGLIALEIYGGYKTYKYIKKKQLEAAVRKIRETPEGKSLMDDLTSKAKKIIDLNKEYTETKDSKRKKEIKKEIGKIDKQVKSIKKRQLDLSDVL